MIKPLKKKKCRNCGDLFAPMSSLSIACGMACALDLGKVISEKKADKAHKQRKKEFYENDPAFQKAKAQKSFNEFIRLRDSKLGCISCDKPADWGGQWHASHWKSRGARPDLAFNEDNVHKACSVCNNWLSGNVDEFRKSLVIRIGLERVAALEVDNNIQKLRAEDFIGIHKKYQTKIKELKNN